MGGDLSQGTVKGDAIACPFHDWRWGGDGRCAGIPYARRVPVAARTRAWRTLERNGHLFVWNDPEGNAPPDDVTIPFIEGASSDEWTAGPGTPSWSRGRTAARSSTTWWTWRTSSTSTSPSHVLQERLRGAHRVAVPADAVPADVGGASNYSSGDDGQTTLRSEASYYGPAYMIDYLWHDYHGMGIESVLINCHYPVTPTSFLLQWGAIVRRPPGLSDAQASRVAAKFADFVGLGFQQDVEIWLHKTRIDNPLLCAEDGPVYQVRRWYEQFYRDVADVEPDMVARFEFEIDTTRAVAGWEAGGGGQPGPAGRCRLTADGPLRGMSGGPPSAPSSAGGAARGAGRQVQPAAHLGAVERGGGAGVLEFSAAWALGRPSALVQGCGSLRDSIDAAVMAGRLEVSPPLEVTPP
jgi:Phenylpropionate dioxygenase and related ring-hydroxylating dioxygenases, large terminal subunit